MNEAPDPREDEDCPSGAACNWSCDQHTFDPENGHIFVITHKSRGSYSIVGDDKHYFEPEENLASEPEFTFRVQAWSLMGALEKAAKMPFNELMGEQ